VRGEARDLLSLEVRNFERLAMSGRPNRLRHVPEVEAPALEGSVAKDGEGAEAGREDEDPAGDDGARDGP
jgi:hypothetical protein